MTLEIDLNWVTIPQPIRFIGYRCLHAAEGGFVNPVGMPNIRRALDQPPVIFTPQLQALAYELMRSQNSTITQNNFDNTFDSDTAWTNRHGVESNDPKLMDGLICAGMFLAQEGSETVIIDNVEYLVFSPGIHAIDPSQPLPTVEQILARGWYFVANTGTGASGAFHFPQGNQGPVYIPYVLQQAAKYRKEWFTTWDSDHRPDSLRYGG